MLHRGPLWAHPSTTIPESGCEAEPDASWLVSEAIRARLRIRPAGT